MKSGLRDRNNALVAQLVEASDLVSMKSGLGDRNNTSYHEDLLAALQSQ